MRTGQRCARRRLERQLLVMGLLLTACGGHTASPREMAAGGRASGEAGSSSSAGARGPTKPGGGKTADPGAGGSASSGGDAGSVAGAAASSGAGGMGGYGFVQCPAGTRTKLSGTVRDPAARVPVYGAAVYVPSSTLGPLPEGASCDLCAELARGALALSVTNEYGHFELEAPAGVDVPLVVQMGKWRRRVTVPAIQACVDNELEDPELTRLPRKHSEGSLPRMAVTSGAADAMSCFLRRMGIADEEFTTPQGDGNVHVFAGCDAAPTSSGFAQALGGADFPAASELYQSSDELLRYDAVLLGCDDGACPDQYGQYADNLLRYANSGGRLFLNHSQAGWLQHGPSEWQDLLSPRQAARSAPEPLTAYVDTSFPKGAALSAWLLGTGASAQTGELLVHGAAFSFNPGPQLARRWLYANDESAPDDSSSVLLLTQRTPVNAPDDQQCGRLTFSDFHINNPAAPDSDARFPNGCADAPLSPQEMLLEFLMFDQSLCVSSGVDPKPPRP